MKSEEILAKEAARRAKTKRGRRALRPANAAVMRSVRLGHEIRRSGAVYRGAPERFAPTPTGGFIKVAAGIPFVRVG